MRPNKKGVTLDTAPTILLTLTLTVMVGVAGALALSGMRDTTSLSTESTFKTDTEAFDDGVAEFFGTLDNNGNLPTCTGFKAQNGTTDVTANFTVSTTACTATLNTLSYENVTMNINWTNTVKAYDYAYNQTVKGNSGLSNLSDQFGTIGTVIGVALIVGAVIGGFAIFTRAGGM